MSQIIPKPPLFRTDPAPAAPAPTAPTTKAVREDCPACGREMAVHFDGRLWCIHCDEGRLWPEVRQIGGEQ